MFIILITAKNVKLLGKGEPAPVRACNQPLIRVALPYYQNVTFLPISLLCLTLLEI